MGNKRNKKAIKKFDETEKDSLKEIGRASWFTGPVYGDIFHSLPHPVRSRLSDQVRM